VSTGAWISRPVRKAFLYVLMFLFGLAAGAECPPCGPDFCHGDSRYPAKLAAKKTAMKQDGYPADLIALMDRGGECVASVERAPDGFSIKVVSSSGSTTLPWTEDDERIARDNLLNGKIVRYYKFNAARAFVCCNDPKPEDRPDWDPADAVSKDQAITCTKVGNAVKCK
jgi:hypothetical protein